MSKIVQEIRFNAPPESVYRALVDAREHAQFTGAPADVSAEAGGAFSCYGGKVHGRQIELIPNERIVQVWRPAHWPAGAYTVARFDLEADADGTRLRFEQDAVPEDQKPHLEKGWHDMYWNPLRKHLDASG